MKCWLLSDGQGWVILYENILQQHSDIVKVSNFLDSKGSVGVAAWGTDGLMIKTRNYSSLGLSVERGAQMDWAEPAIGIYCRRIRARDKPMGNIYHCIQHTLILQWDPLWWVKSVVHGLVALFINVLCLQKLIHGELQCCTMILPDCLHTTRRCLSSWIWGIKKEYIRNI